MSISDRIRYLAACHQADNRETAVLDIFHKAIRHRHVASGTEVLSSGLQDGLAIPTEVGLACVPAGVMALVATPRVPRGVLFELSELASREPPPPSDQASTIPAILSRAQQKVLRSARSHPLTLVVGPPGTGKSYTVRARTSARQEKLFSETDFDLLMQAFPQVAFLDEHYRSMPSIIAFSNREFYEGRLRVMTARPATAKHRALEVRRVPGKREHSGVNPIEIEALVDEVASWVERDRSLPAEVSHSIGVLSPFRDQVDRLSDAVAKRLSFESIEKHDVLVATPYGFPGEERDVMLLSLTVDDGAHPATLRYLNQPDVFNVAITRARDYQFVFTSLSLDAAQPDGLLGRYLTSIFRRATEPEPTTDVDDGFLDAVMARLGREGFHLFPAYAVAGMTVDLVVERGRAALGIDLIGHPGELAPAIDRERYRMLRRAGLPIMPLPLSAWRRSPDICVAALRARVRG